MSGLHSLVFQLRRTQKLVYTTENSTIIIANHTNFITLNNKSHSVSLIILAYNLLYDSRWVWGSSIILGQGVKGESDGRRRSWMLTGQGIDKLPEMVTWCPISVVDHHLDWYSGHSFHHYIWQLWKIHRLLGFLIWIRTNIPILFYTTLLALHSAISDSDCIYRTRILRQLVNVYSTVDHFIWTFARPVSLQGKWIPLHRYASTILLLGKLNSFIAMGYCQTVCVYSIGNML